MSKRDIFVSDQNRMPKRELLKLKPGDQVVVFWAKDNDPDDIRCHYEKQTVEKWDDHYPELLHVEDGYEWDLRQMADDDSVADTSRGWVYFFQPE